MSIFITIKSSKSHQSPPIMFPKFLLFCIISPFKPTIMYLFNIANNLQVFDK